MKPKHQRRKNGQCYSTCPVCRKGLRQTDEILRDVCLRLTLQFAYSLGFGNGIASVRWPREEFVKMAQSLPEPYRDLALSTPDWRQIEPKKKANAA